MATTPYARLSHPTRPTLALEQTQQDRDSIDAKGNVVSEIGTGKTPLIHTETREGQIELRGLITGNERARRDSATDDWEQALSNYVQALEARVDEFQGEGYTLENDLRGTEKPVVFDTVSWTLQQGRPFDIEYEGTLQVGQGVFDTESLNTDDATINTSMDYAATVAGEPLPGLRQMQVSTEMEVELNAIFDRSSAENNEVVPKSSEQREIQFQGTHTGSFSEREQAEKTLRSLVATDIVSFKTRFPGYELEGKVMGYESNFQASFGEQRHEYTLRFVEGRQA